MAQDTKMAFTDWSEKLDKSEVASNSWLPAYGFQTPTTIQLHQDEEFYTNEDETSCRSGNHLILETIVEENSDDLQSETSSSDYNSSSCTSFPDSFNVPSYVFTNGKRACLSSWSAQGSRLLNTDPGVQDEDDFTDDTEEGDEEEYKVEEGSQLEDIASRTSSLLQFESLENDYASAFKLQKCPSRKTVYGGGGLAVRSLSQPDLQSGNIDKDNMVRLSSFCTTDASENDSDDATLLAEAGRTLAKSSSSLICRSIDSLTATAVVVTTLTNKELSKSSGDITAASDPPTKGTTPSLYKTVHCLSKIFSGGEEMTPPLQQQSSILLPTKTKSSVENLSEDSGFGEQSREITRKEIMAGSESNGMAVVETENVFVRDASQKSNFGWRISDSAVLDEQLGDGDCGSILLTTADMTSCSDHYSMLRSTPNLRSWDHASSLKKINFGSEGKLSKGTSKGSNLQITTSFVNLSCSALGSGNTRGVRFCPVVSEVSWRCEYSSSSNGNNSDCGTDNEEDDGVDCYESVEDIAMEEEIPMMDGKRREMSPAVDELVKQLLTVEGVEWEAEERERIPRLNFIGGETLAAVDIGQRHSSIINDSMDGASSESTTPGKKSSGKISGFFQRFTLRLSGRKKKKTTPPSPTPPPPVVVACLPKVSGKEAVALREESTPVLIKRENGNNSKENYEEMEGHGGKQQRLPQRPPPSLRVVCSSKPPLPPAPPRRHEYPSDHIRIFNVMPRVHRIDPTALFLETDVDSNVTSSTCVSSKKSRSLLDLEDNGGCIRGSQFHKRTLIGEKGVQVGSGTDYKAKSMEFLLDQENRSAVKPPENELRKGDRKLSEHELRVQRSLQKLSLPEWYKNSQIPTQGFLLKRNSDTQAHLTSTRWTRTATSNLPPKTISLSSLGSNVSAIPRSPTVARSPGNSNSYYSFSRWSTSRLNGPGGNTSSNDTSPSGSVRSSFNYRQPYLGWRSQERLSKPRTPAERLAAGLLPQQSDQDPALSPSLNEIRTSIKEVTSAIEHYVSGGHCRDGPLSPQYNNSPRSASPKGSMGRLYWLESSFVGSKPLDIAETPTEDVNPNFLRNLDRKKPKLLPPVPRKYSQQTHQDKNILPENNPKYFKDIVLIDKIGESGAVNNGWRRMEKMTIRCSMSEAVEIPSHPVKLLVQCQFPKCGRMADPSEAKKYFKVCHNCDYVYCSRECRRLHWNRHKKICLHSRIGELCRNVLAHIKNNPDVLLQASIAAKIGYATKGRGCLKFVFRNPQIAGQFSTGLVGNFEPFFLMWEEVMPTDMGTVLYAQLQRIIHNYNPQTRMVVFVVVHVLSEIPSTGGPVKFERQIVSRCAKTHLSPALVFPRNA